MPYVESRRQAARAFPRLRLSRRWICAKAREQEMLTDEIRQSVDESVLCWLATCGADASPNVSPKEIFLAYGEDEIIIANIASPKSVKNIRVNPQVCVSFVHVFKQKGFKLKGKASYLQKGDSGYEPRFERIFSITGDAFPVKGIIAIKVEKAAKILAPSYLFFPDTTEAAQIEAAHQTYGVFRD